MILPAVLLAISLGADPCAERAARASELEQSARASEERLGAALAHLDAELGTPLLLPDEASRPAQERARLAGARLESRCAMRALPPVTAEGDRARLKAILDRPEFANARGGGGDVLAHWMRRLRQWLDELFETRGAQGYAEVTRSVVLALAIAAVVAAVLWLRRRRGTAQAAQAREERPGALKLDSPQEHLARARAALPSDAREAIREGLLGLLSGLEQQRLARPDRVKTNRELASELPVRGASTELTAQVAELLRWYDRTFYSLEPVPVAEAARFLERVDQLGASLGGAP